MSRQQRARQHRVPPELAPLVAVAELGREPRDLDALCRLDCDNVNDAMAVLRRGSEEPSPEVVRCRRAPPSPLVHSFPLPRSPF